MSEILEIVMLICFGASWPFNVVKSYKARTAKGKSLTFLILVIVGYIAGIAAKFTSSAEPKWYVVFFYILNAVMVSIDLVLYFRNRYIDRLKGGYYEN